MSKIKIEEGATFIQSQVGDFNSMMNNINPEIGHIDEIKPLIGKLRDAIEKSPAIGKYEKEDALNGLQEVVKRLSKPTEQQDKEGIAYYWKKVIGVIKDIGQIIPIAKSLGELLKLPLL